MSEYFGEVKQYEDDLKNVLEVREFPLTENNIAKLRTICESHWFTDFIIEAGLTFMYNNIGNGDGWDKYE